MVEADAPNCPDCEGPLLVVFRGGYFCRRCEIALSVSDGWAHILGPALVERRIPVRPPAP